jgi:ADP-ribose pyrophosphatase
MNLESKRSEKLTDNRHMNLWEIKFVHGLGRPRKGHLATRSTQMRFRAFGTPDSVVIVPFHQGEQRFVIIQESRATLGRYQLVFR